MLLILAAALLGLAGAAAAQAPPAIAPALPNSVACDAQLQMVEAGRRQAEQLVGKLYEQLQDAQKRLADLTGKPPVPPAPVPTPPPTEEKK